MQADELAILLATALRPAGGGVSAPDAPTGLAATVISTSRIDLAWTDAASNETEYRVYRSTDNVSYSLIDTIAADLEAYSDTTIASGTTYYYKVAAANAGGEALSDVASAYVTTPVQSLGSELLTNPDMDFSAGALTGWTLVGTTVGGDPGISEVASGGGAGTGSVRFYNTVTPGRPVVNQTVMTVGDYYEFVSVAGTRTVGSVDVWGAGGAILGATGATCRPLGRTTLGVFTISGRGNPPHDLVIDSASVKKITPNTQISAPSADMEITQFYTLPGSPELRTALWLMPRISNFASGNYWLAFLEYSQSATWDVTLYSVAAHTRTARISTVTNIGANNGIRVNMNGDSISLYTTANGGGSWTQRGSTISNALYNTATGVNVLASSTITLGALSGVFLM